jgi:hypothetical protein
MRRLTDLLMDLVSAIERNGIPAFEQVDLKQTVTRSLQQLSGKPLQHGISFINQIHEGLQLLSVEQGQIELVFELLLEAEIIRLPSGSHVSLSARPRFEENPELEIRIRDDGPRASQRSI